MNPSRYEFTCDCGKLFNLNHDNLGRMMMCPKCDRRFTLPTDLVPVGGTSLAAAAANNSSEKTTNKSSKIKYLLTGSLMIIAGGGLVGSIYLSFKNGRVHRRMGYLALFSVVLILMGFGTVLKGIFGDRMEWD